MEVNNERRTTVSNVINVRMKFILYISDLGSRILVREDNFLHQTFMPKQ